MILFSETGEAVTPCILADVTNISKVKHGPTVSACFEYEGEDSTISF